MLPSNLLAHPGQSLTEHLADVAERAALFAAQFNASDHACLSGWLHDLGKAETEFQKRINSDNKAGEKQPHAHHGAALALAHQLWPVAFAINGHHAGLHTFQVAILEAGTGRFALRSWDSSFLGEVDRRYRAYFEAIRLPGADPVRLGSLAAATIAKSKKGSKTKPACTTYNAIFQTAWAGTRPPHRLLEAAITRQCVELAKGCDKKDRDDFESRLRARTALIKLYFYSSHIAPDKPMNESTHDMQDHPAYLCGRVLALLDRIHNAAHGKSTASSPAGRFYGSASSTPALVFPRLCNPTPSAGSSPTFASNVRCGIFSPGIRQPANRWLKMPSPSLVTTSSFARGQ